MKSYALQLILAVSVAACTWAKPALRVPVASQPGGAAPNQAPAKAPAAVPPAPDRWDAQRRQGIAFVATGTEPFWTLEIGPERGMRFKSLGGVDSLNTPLPPPSQAQDAPVTRYRAVTEAGELVVTITQRACTNDMSGETVPYTVAVQAKTTLMPKPREFTGCGRYLGDYRLHDLWALESMDGQAVAAAQFATKDKPYLELNLTSGQALGFSGCNGFGGSLTPERAGLRFGTLRGTMLACPALAFEQGFRKALSGQSFAYQVENRRLTLKNRATTLVLRKFD
ncbi:hypothetical protein GCM10022406_16820 [Hymenobacter algoricola]|uniref:DUF306 domain-containing protein n=1 Tax=Hymenobacter algoricola TaxID=486267 RepID=A0ABP7N1N6_9BACT